MNTLKSTGNEEMVNEIVFGISKMYCTGLIRFELDQLKYQGCANGLPAMIMLLKYKKVHSKNKPKPCQRDCNDSVKEITRLLFVDSNFKR